MLLYHSIVKYFLTAQIVFGCIFIQAQTQYEVNLRSLLPENSTAILQKDLPGNWKFIKLENRQGEKIDSIFIDLSKDTGISNYGIHQKVMMNDYCFTGTSYATFYSGQNTANGRWEYDQENKILYLLFEKPVIMMEGMKPVKGNELYIKYISEEEMHLLELVHNTENPEMLEYNIAVYKKVGVGCQ
jgi:hypothetical protein